MKDRDLDWWRDWRFYVGAIITGLVWHFADRVLP